MNASVLTQKQQVALLKKTVAVVGMGGLGGHVSEQLLRMGVRHLILIDGDAFEMSNLNRQRFATEETIGRSKVLAAREALIQIDKCADIAAHPCHLTRENARALLDGADLVIDALDSAHARLVLEDASAEIGIPIVHGAVRGRYGQVTFSAPGEYALRRLYNGAPSAAHAAPASTPALVASIQADQAIRYLACGEAQLNGRLLRLDLTTLEMRVIKLNTEGRK